MSIQNIRRLHTIGELAPVYVAQRAVRAAHQAGDPSALDGEMTIEALPTWYAGTKFRSNLEADWAATLDSLGIEWAYEPETVTLPSGATYIPDFWLPRLGTWLEVKGTGVPRIEKAIELGQTRACHCDGECACQWRGGELVLIGHPPAPYESWRHPADVDRGWRHTLRRQKRHPGYPVWSTAHGRSARLARCLRCQQAGWFEMRAPVSCRACDGLLRGSHAYASGDSDLEFVRCACRPSPRQEDEECA